MESYQLNKTRKGRAISVTYLQFRVLAILHTPIGLGDEIQM